MDKNELREMVFSLSHGYCMCSPDCTEKATDIHHLLPNTKVNKRLYPLFIESIFNKLPINNGCHLNKPIPTIKPHQAQIYEIWLNAQWIRED